jgi:cell division protein FtsI (penicillin-binding protein 3)
MKATKIPPLFTISRHYWMIVILLFLMIILIWRAAQLHISNQEFLQNQGDARVIRNIPISAHRGMLLDRNHQPLAISVPTESVWVNPQLLEGEQRWQKLLQLLNKPIESLKDFLNDKMTKEFVYVKRHLSPQLAENIRNLKMPGVFLQPEYQRFYPASETTAHVLGFTDIDDHGLEGLEKGLESRLKGISGKRAIVQNRQGQPIGLAGELHEAKAGETLQLTIDRRLSDSAHQILKNAVRQHHAKSGSAVILDAKNGDVLAMVNQPDYNPNNREQRPPVNFYRNRAMTDVFEPGSTMKPFTIAAALESGKYSQYSTVDTGSGELELGEFTINDAAGYGQLDLTKIIQKSSNIGAAKIALSLKSEQLWNLLYYAGFGVKSQNAFLGEVSGFVPYFSDWNHARHASIGFGYGLNVTLLQLAHSYTAFTNEGFLPAIRFVVDKEKQPISVIKVMKPQTAKSVLNMLEKVVSPEGTGNEASVEGYRVGGKTGTARKTIRGAYVNNRYFSLFVGVAPLSKPRLVVAVLIDEPNDEYYGGKVAAPVFSQIMADALHLLNIPPDVK